MRCGPALLVLQSATDKHGAGLSLPVKGWPRELLSEYSSADLPVYSKKNDKTLNISAENAYKAPQTYRIDPLSKRIDVSFKYSSP